MSHLWKVSKATGQRTIQTAQADRHGEKLPPPFLAPLFQITPHPAPSKAVVLIHSGPISDKSNLEQILDTAHTRKALLWAVVSP